MGVSEELDGLRDAFEDCSIVAFADIETRLVLVSSSKGVARRETLDSLCASAADTFGNRKALPITEADMHIVASRTGLEIFFNLPEHAGDALCCVCEPSIDLDAFVAAARDTFDRVLNPAGDAA
ncbi:MAG: hypothetical protein AAF729_08380 [Pseudomonadota bacterium]